MLVITLQEPDYTSDKFRVIEVVLRNLVHGCVRFEASELAQSRVKRNLKNDGAYVLH